MYRIAHISDIHVGDWNPEVAETAKEELIKLKPELIIANGDLTNKGTIEQYRIGRKYLEELKEGTEAEMMVVSGNHDLRDAGYEVFRKHFGGFPKVLDFKSKYEHAHVVGLKSGLPDLNDGMIGERQRDFLDDDFSKVPNHHIKIVVFHHHLLPVPLGGRERNILYDAGDVIDILMRQGVDLVFHGHRHVPNVYMLSNIVVLNAGTISCKKKRSWLPNTYNLVELTEKEVVVKLAEVGGRTHEFASFKKTIIGDEYMLMQKMRRSITDIYPVPEL